MHLSDFQGWKICVGWSVTTLFCCRRQDDNQLLVDEFLATFYDDNASV